VGVRVIVGVEVGVGVLVRVGEKVGVKVKCGVRSGETAAGVGVAGIEPLGVKTCGEGEYGTGVDVNVDVMTGDGMEVGVNVRAGVAGCAISPVLQRTDWAVNSRVSARRRSPTMETTIFLNGDCFVIFVRLFGGHSSQ
jgi:hypothetical protein